MGRITARLASGAVSKASGVLLAAFTIALFVLNLRRAGERAGRWPSAFQHRREPMVQRQMLDAASRRPADRNALAERLRDGRF
ncbi:hypothetical protein E4L95_16795 [Paracoccus liaowanqingii]|uniref:Uncharacterized protein n=1 Tax=Paracoccus liaowanqingii TaxID=2560053 RepID=A0A4P7HP52_9RHOB|nr:hypothetical protein [Paracoccus liaowanqingii]QBX35031.1 hypothetical protein E4191_10165 [Paracoccus liaowanqingii]TGN51520.1 hypothetical protein E4L95_16795 [Paracoccus liaowanqingii]